jgi:hypothetical protein
MAVAELRKRVRLSHSIPLYPTEKLWDLSNSLGAEYCPEHRDHQGSRCIRLSTSAIRPVAGLRAGLKEPLRLDRILPPGSTNPTLDKAVIYTMACGSPYLSTQRIYMIATEKGTLVSKENLDMGSCGRWNKIEFPDQPIDLSGMNVLNAGIWANLVTVPPLSAEFHFMGMELVVSAEVDETVTEKAEVRVCVKDSKTNRAIPLASVELWSDRLVKSGRTGLSGCATLSDVPTTRTGARYKLVASAFGYASTSMPVTVVPGFNDFEVKLEQSVPEWAKWGVIGAGAIVIGGTVMAYARRGAGGE